MNMTVCDGLEFIIHYETYKVACGCETLRITVHPRPVTVIAAL